MIKRSKLVTAEPPVSTCLAGAGMALAVVSSVLAGKDSKSLAGENPFSDDSGIKTCGTKDGIAGVIVPPPPCPSPLLLFARDLFQRFSLSKRL